MLRRTIVGLQKDRCQMRAEFVRGSGQTPNMPKLNKLATALEIVEMIEDAMEARENQHGYDAGHCKRGRTRVSFGYGDDEVDPDKGWSLQEPSRSKYALELVENAGLEDADEPGPPGMVPSSRGVVRPSEGEKRMKRNKSVETESTFCGSSVEAICEHSHLVESYTSLQSSMGPCDLRSEICNVSAVGNQLKTCMELLGKQSALDENLAAVGKKSCHGLSHLRYVTEQFNSHFSDSVAIAKDRLVPGLETKRTERGSFTCLIGLCEEVFREMRERSTELRSIIDDVLTDIRSFEMLLMSVDGLDASTTAAVQEASENLQAASVVPLTTNFWKSVHRNETYFNEMVESAQDLRILLVDLGKNEKLPAEYDVFCASLECICTV